MGRDLNRHFSKEDTHMAKRHMKRCSKSLTAREMEIETIMRFIISPQSKWLLAKDPQTDFSGGPAVKNPPANARKMHSIPGPGRSYMPWGNQVHVPQLLSLLSRAPCCSTRFSTSTKSSSSSLQLEKAHTAMKTQHRQK